MRNILFSLLIVLLTISALKAQTTVNGSFMHNGITREYILYVPAAYNANTAVPLLFNLHGYTSNNLQQMFYGDFKPIADTANFIIVAPNGTFDNLNQRFWNAWGLAQPDDIGFINALIDTVSAHYNINPNRIYSTGMSNGGIMSYTLACSLSHRITAVASVTGTMATTTLNTCAPWRPVPVMEIHGTADPTVPYEGGGGLGAASIDDIMEHWVTFNNCNTIPDSADVPNTDPNDGCTAKHYVWNNGNMGSTVELFKIIGGEHTWPGAAFTIGVTNQDINACREIWRFFSQYDMGMFATGAAETPITKGFSVYPNPSANNFMLNFAGEGKKTITVINTLGQTVKTLTVSGKQAEVTIDVAGLYFVTVTEGPTLSTQKVIKQ